MINNQRKLLFLDNHCIDDFEGREYYDSIMKIINDPNIQLQAWFFKKGDHTEFLETIPLAITKSKENLFDAILLNITTIEQKLNIAHTIQLFIDAGIPLILVSNAIFDNKQDNNAIKEFQSHRGQLCCITFNQLKYLGQYMYGLGHLHDNNSSINYGFLYRDEKSINIREYILERFNTSASEVLESKRIEVPLIAPVSNFLANEPGMPRPLQYKDSNKLFAAVANDGNALSVRYEGTALVTKLVADNYRKNEGTRYNYHYFQEMVRMEFKKNLDKDHYRAFYQAGVELFTTKLEEHLNNICNTIVFLLHFTQLLDSKLTLIARFSHINILKPLDIFLSKEEDRFAKNKLVHIMEKGSEFELLELLKSLNPDAKRDRFLIRLKQIQLQRLTVSKGVERIISLPEYNEFNIDISELIQIKDNPNLSNCVFDPGIHRSLDFYSGITMQGDLEYNGVVQKEFLGGGSFSGMVESFGYCGCPVFSFGIAIGVERIMNILNDNTK